MKAISMANGSVFFVPDEIERKSKALSYAALTAEAKQDAAPKKKISLFDRLMKRDRLQTTARAA